MRVPKSLQTVFLASNRGEEVTEPPADGTAFKVFNRRRLSSSSHHSLRKSLTKVKSSFRNASGKDSKYKCMFDEAEDTVSCYSSHSSSGDSQHSGEDMPDDIQIKRIGSVGSDEGTQRGISPQKYLDELLRSRGYLTSTEKAIDACVYTNPSPVHFVCRSCDHETLKIIFEAGTDLAIRDDDECTPLHSVCKREEPCFKIIEMLVSENLNLFFLTDNDDSTPLSYLSTEYWEECISFIEERKDVWWPLLDSANAESVRASTMKTSPRKKVSKTKYSHTALQLVAHMEATGLLSLDEPLVEDSDSDVSDYESNDGEEDDDDVDDESSWASYDEYDLA